MLTKRWMPALIIVAAVLVVAGVVASKGATSQANDAVGQPIIADQTLGQAGENSQHAPVAFVGVALSSLQDGQAEEAGLDGGALVVSVVDGSPADGLLLDGDIITAVGGQAVAGPSDVVEIVRSSQPGDVLTFTLHRDGASIDVDITAGERQTPASAFLHRTATRFLPPHVEASPVPYRSDRQSQWTGPGVCQNLLPPGLCGISFRSSHTLWRPSGTKAPFA